MNENKRLKTQVHSASSELQINCVKHKTEVIYSSPFSTPIIEQVTCMLDYKGEQMPMQLIPIVKLLEKTYLFFSSNKRRTSNQRNLTCIVLVNQWKQFMTPKASMSFPPSIVSYLILFVCYCIIISVCSYLALTL